MVPSYFMQLERMPLSANGKLDKKTLPSPDAGTAIAPDCEPPANETEKQLLEMWADVLKLPAASIGVTHNFFDIGGHSLLAMTVVNRVLGKYKVTVPLKIFFIDNTVRLLAAHIDMQLWLQADSNIDTDENKIVI
jgi:hypothetical protein